MLIAATLLWLGSRTGSPDIIAYANTTQTARSPAIGENFAVVTGTPWATDAAMAVLRSGGNACDAAVAALLMINVTHGEAAAFAGIAPTLYYNAKTNSVSSYIGVGTAPKAATPEVFAHSGDDYIPSLDIRAQLIPAEPDVIAGLLSDCGSRSFAELAQPAIEQARKGTPAHAIVARNLDLAWYERLGMKILMPSTTDVWLRDGWWKPLQLNQRLIFPELANSLQAMSDAETHALSQGKTRAKGIQAARDYFYRGPIAAAIDSFHQQEGGLIALEDLANYGGDWEPPIVSDIGTYRFFGNGTWSQGMMEPLVLKILRDAPLLAMGHNTPNYIHTVTQAIELAMSDRDTYVGDSAFVNVPLAQLLSDEYAVTRRSSMNAFAFSEPAPAGKIRGYGASSRPDSPHASAFSHSAKRQLTEFSQFSVGQDTSQLVVVDQAGNAVVITPSDFPKSPMLPSFGINLGDRMTQFRLDPDHINVLAPGKRPRVTPHSVIVFKDGQFYLAFSTPGGDMQAQALVQVFLNMTVFEMSLQDAISAPRFYSINSPSSFSPHERTPAGLRLETPLYKKSANGLRAMGYDTLESPRWDKDFGAVGAILKLPDGSLMAAADPREETTAAAQ